MKLICITGMDGAGKTTLAHKVVAFLQENGQPARYVYGRTYPLVSRLLMALGRAVFLRKKDIWQDYQGYEAGKKQVMRNPLLTRVYTAAIWLDYSLQMWVKLAPYLFRRGGAGCQRYIILDRYVYDTVISDLSAHLGYTASQTLQAIERGLRFLPRPALVILIDLPAEVAFARKHDVPHVDYLRQRRGLYRLLKDSPGVIFLDGAQEADRILADTLEAIAGRLPD